MATPSAPSTAHLPGADEDVVARMLADAGPSPLIAESQDRLEQAALAGQGGRGDAALGQESEGPCNGPCCALAGSACCSFMGAASLHVSTCPLAMDVASPRADDRFADGFDPDSDLRPPKSFV
ncbi:MAG: hypothetical protein K2Y29_01690 [Beijerinckiaceae bacterium]|nr:hypothetical protein [Beijerinckiaceae bacterium]